MSKEKRQPCAGIKCPDRELERKSRVKNDVSCRLFSCVFRTVCEMFSLSLSLTSTWHSREDQKLAKVSTVIVFASMLPQNPRFEWTLNILFSTLITLLIKIFWPTLSHHDKKKFGEWWKQNNKILLDERKSQHRMSTAQKYSTLAIIRLLQAQPMTTRYTVARRHLIVKRKIQTVIRLLSLGMQNVRGKCKATTMISHQKRNNTL